MVRSFYVYKVKKQQITKRKRGKIMSKKEIMDLVLSKVEEDKKETFIQELREAKTKEERLEITKKYNATLTKDEGEKIKASKGNAVSDEELDEAAGGCNCACSAHCSSECICGY